LVIATSLSIVEKWAASEPRFWLILNVLLFSSAITLIFRFGEGLQKSPGTVLKNGKSVLSETDLQNHVMSLVSHELRNELSVMNTALSDLARYKNSDARVSNCQTQLVNVYLQMKHVVESFLLAERLESKSSGIIYSFVEPRRLVSEAIDTVRRSGHQCAIHVDATTLPERSRIDGDVFKVVLINVLQNAIKYSGSKSEIFIRGSYADKNLKISVIDNGIGMSKMAISQLCQHHFRADPNSKGAGLGLYLVRLMLKAHGGGVRISSTPNRGTNVEFWLDTE
jgi:signal transduction histidine kinase